MKLDTRVKLNQSPYCKGIVIDKRISMRSHELIEKYQVLWDDKTYGISGWLRPSQLTIVHPVL